MKGLKIFYSYSHKDEAYRLSLESHLSILSRKKIISGWSDRDITAGQEWKREIDENIKSADIIILLVSSDFIASDYCFDIEMEVAMQRHEKLESIVIPVILRPTDWSDTPFGRLQALPKDAKPVSKWESEDEAWLNVVEGLRARIEEIHKERTRVTARRGFIEVNQLLKKEIESIDQAYRMDDQPTVKGIPTGLMDFDYYTDGICKSELTVIASRPECGAADFSRQIAAHVSTKEKTSVAIFSMVSTAENVIRQIIGMESKIGIDILFKGQLDESHWPRLELGVRTLKDAPIYIDDSMSYDLADLLHACGNIIKDKSVRLIIVDNLQRILFNERKLNSNVGVSDISKELQVFCRDNKVAILVVVNLSRDIDSRPNKRPLESDLSNFGSLSEDASLIIFMYREEIYNDETQEWGIAEAIVAKNDQLGRVGTIRLAYEKQYRFFGNLAIQKGASQ